MVIFTISIKNGIIMNVLRVLCLSLLFVSEGEAQEPPHLNKFQEVAEEIAEVNYSFCLHQKCPDSYGIRPTCGGVGAADNFTYSFALEICAIQIMRNGDEAALVISHELAHLIYGHYGGGNEIEADELGVLLMARAGYSPDNGLGFLRRVYKNFAAPTNAVYFNTRATHIIDMMDYLDACAKHLSVDHREIPLLLTFKGRYLKEWSAPNCKGPLP